MSVSVTMKVNLTISVWCQNHCKQSQSWWFRRWDWL